jgi:glutamyl-tRNA reductase
MYVHRGREAVRHLFRVVAGLESLVPGEAEIQGQVGDAYEVARRVGGGTADSLLHRLFQEALAAGGDVRARTAVGEGAASVPSAAVSLARKVYGELEGCRAVVVGAGAMGRLTMECLVDHGVRHTAVASRTLERARGLAEVVGGEPVELESVAEILADVDILVTCTSAGEPILRVSDLAERGEMRGHPLVILDIAVPRDVEPDVEQFPEIFLYNIDDLQRVVEGAESARLSEVPRAEEILEEGVDAFCRWVRSRQAVPMIRELRGRARDVQEGALEELFAELERGEGARGLDQEERAVIREAVRKLVNRLLHEPTVALRETAGGPDGDRYLEAMRRLFDLGAAPGEEQGMHGRGTSSTDVAEEIDDG